MFRAGTDREASLEAPDSELQGATMSHSTAILVNGILDLGVVLAVAAGMLVPFRLDRRKKDAAVYAFAAPLPEDLAA
jgi:hypothetical protein